MLVLDPFLDLTDVFFRGSMTVSCCTVDQDVAVGHLVEGMGLLGAHLGHILEA